MLVMLHFCDRRAIPRWNTAFGLRDRVSPAGRGPVPRVVRLQPPITSLRGDKKRHLRRSLQMPANCVFGMVWAESLTAEQRNNSAKRRGNITKLQNNSQIMDSHAQGKVC